MRSGGRLPAGTPCKHTGLKVHSWRLGRTVRWGQAGPGVAGSGQNIPAYYLPCCPSELRLLAALQSSACLLGVGGRVGRLRCTRGPRRSAPGKDPLGLQAGTPGPRLVSVTQPPPAALPPRSAGSQVTRTKPGPQSRNNQAPEPDSCPSALLPTRMPAWGGTEAAPP